MLLVDGCGVANVAILVWMAQSHHVKSNHKTRFCFVHDSCRPMRDTALESQCPSNSVTDGKAQHWWKDSTLNSTSKRSWSTWGRISGATALWWRAKQARKSFCCKVTRATTSFLSWLTWTSARRSRSSERVSKFTTSALDLRTPFMNQSANSSSIFF